jgi:hypothetical protein
MTLAKEFGDPFPFGALVVLDTELVHPPGLPDSCVLWVKTEAQKKVLYCNMTRFV